MAAPEEVEAAPAALQKKLQHEEDAAAFGDEFAEEKKAPVKPEPSAPPAPAPAPGRAKVARLFGRERSIHAVLGGGQPADVLLWRKRNTSAGVVGFATVIWILFELLHYHLLTFVCHALIFSLATLFLWSSASSFINKAPPRIPEVKVPEDLAVNVAMSLRYEINRAFATLREIAAGQDIQKFLIVIAGLWFLSILGKHCTSLTLLYTVFMLLHTVPVLYEKYEDQVDAFGEKAMAEVQKQYAVVYALVDAQVLSKIPRGPTKDKKM